MGKKVAILQSNYIPWKGYFDMIAAVDEFILYDDVQFTKNDWRNRNQIKTPTGFQWLSIPVGQRLDRRVRDVILPDTPWRKVHWKTLEANYSRAPYFDEVAELLAPLYLSDRPDNLSSLNRLFIERICAYLGIRTVISNSWDYTLGAGRVERVVSLCEQAGAATYVSGPAAKAYMDDSLFELKGIRLEWFEYGNYPEYAQLWGPFSHRVSVVDLLFNCGPKARDHMMCGRNAG